MILNEGGLCVFHHSFSKIEINPQLVGGFATAIKAFSAEIVSFNQTIEKLEMSRLVMRISTFLNNNFTLILFANKYDNLQVLDEIIYELESLFIEQFGHIDAFDYVGAGFFSEFEDIIINICQTNTNMVVLSPQSEIKQNFWKNILKQPELSNDSSPSQYHTVTLPLSNIPNTQLTLWNYDMENINSIFTFLDDKHIILFLIEPTLSYIEKTMASINKIRENYPNLALYGFITKKEGNILKKNLELILNLKIFELDSMDVEMTNKFADIVRSVVISAE